jgi:3-hydroxy-3-methylglutaryl CoA synthase
MSSNADHWKKMFEKEQEAHTDLKNRISALSELVLSLIKQDIVTIAEEAADTAISRHERDYSHELSCRYC